jgi:hypothetical protein
MLVHAAARAEEQPFFLASALTAYRRLAGYDEAGLAVWLGCSPVALARLALCRRPDGESAMFSDEVQRIAAFAGANATRLANLLRTVENAEAMRTPAADALIAAHDRERPAAEDALAPAEPHDAPEAGR